MLCELDFVHWQPIHGEDFDKTPSEMQFVLLNRGPDWFCVESVLAQTEGSRALGHKGKSDNSAAFKADEEDAQSHLTRPDSE